MGWKLTLSVTLIDNGIRVDLRGVSLIKAVLLGWMRSSRQAVSITYLNPDIGSYPSGTFKLDKHRYTGRQGEGDDLRSDR